MLGTTHEELQQLEGVAEVHERLLRHFGRGWWVEAMVTRRRSTTMCRTEGTVLAIGLRHLPVEDVFCRAELARIVRGGGGVVDETADRAVLGLFPRADQAVAAALQARALREAPWLRQGMAMGAVVHVRIESDEPPGFVDVLAGPAAERAQALSALALCGLIATDHGTQGAMPFSGQHRPGRAAR